MDRKGIVAVSLAVLGLILWQLHVARRYVQPPLTPADAVAQASPAAAPYSPAPAATPAEPWVAAPAPAVEQVVPETRTLETPLAQYLFTNQGGGISRIVLSEHLAEGGEQMVLNPAGATPVGALTVEPGEGMNDPWVMQAGHQQVTFRRTLPEQVEIEKVFTLPHADAKEAHRYLITLDVKLTNRGAQIFRPRGYYVYTGSAAPIHDKDLITYTGLSWHRDGGAKFVDTGWFDEGRVPLLGFQTRPAREVLLEPAQQVSWVAVKNQYFASIISQAERKGTEAWARRLDMERPEKKLWAIEAAFGMPGFDLEPGQSVDHQFTIYAGPSEYQRLAKLGNDQEEVMNFGMFKWISVFLLTMMNWLHGFFGNYAYAILVLTVLIRGALWPLQNKATASMKKMQAVAPKMTELREKYKDDPTRMNQEMMKLYKQYGVNPFGGCLPILIQIPIFFGFYSMLGGAVELRNSTFLWVSDLSQPDTIFHIGVFPVNPLPILMAVTMFWQMALTPKTGDAVQQRIFMFLPLIFIFFCYNFASALALYWTAQNLVSIVQLFVTRNNPVPVPQKAAPPPKAKKGGKR